MVKRTINIEITSEGGPGDAYFAQHLVGMAAQMIMDGHLEDSGEDSKGRSFKVKMETEPIEE
jgi:hypothetical protein